MKTGVDASFIDQLLEHLAAEPGVSYDTLARQLRASFPNRHITVCSEDDISPRIKPVAENAVAGIYLVASSDHCLSLTQDAEAATGIVVALRGDED